jgi:CRP-like cAMP-binding protein
MFFKQGEIFWQMDSSFVGEMMEGAEKLSCKAGEILFNKGDPALYYYILIKGRVKIDIEEVGEVVYTVNHAGESFGWSSLVGRKVYSATATCGEATQLIRLNRDHVAMVCKRQADHCGLFYKRIAEVLGNRLIQSYRLLSSSSRAESSPTSGTGQVMETFESV